MSSPHIVEDAAVGHADAHLEGVPLRPEEDDALRSPVGGQAQVHVPHLIGVDGPAQGELRPVPLKYVQILHEDAGARAGYGDHGQLVRPVPVKIPPHRVGRRSVSVDLADQLREVGQAAAHAQQQAALARQQLVEAEHRGGAVVGEPQHFDRPVRPYGVVRLKVPRLLTGRPGQVRQGDGLRV